MSDCANVVFLDRKAVDYNSSIRKAQSELCPSDIDGLQGIAYGNSHMRGSASNLCESRFPILIR